MYAVVLQLGSVLLWLVFCNLCSTCLSVHVHGGDLCATLRIHSPSKPELSSITAILGVGAFTKAWDRLLGVGQHLVLAPMWQIVKGTPFGLVQLQRGCLDAGRCDLLCIALCGVNAKDKRRVQKPFLKSTDKCPRVFPDALMMHRTPLNAKGSVIDAGPKASETRVKACILGSTKQTAC